MSRDVSSLSLAPAPEGGDGDAGETTGDVASYLAGRTDAASERVVSLTTRIPESLRRRIRLTAMEQGRDVQDVAVEAWENWLRSADA